MSFKLIMGLTFLLLSADAMFAQSTYGTLLGTVSDHSGAVVAAATVTVTDVATNTSKTATSNAVGEYEFPNLLPGNYEVTVTAKGFNRFVREGIPLDPRASVRVDASLQVGTEATTVQVTAGPPVITTENATVADEMSGNEISQLPLNYRAVSTTPLYAITTIPNVVSDPSGPTGNRFGTGVSIAGDNPAQNEYTADGFSITSIRYNGALAEMLPSTEAISGLRITSEIAPAEYGQLGDVTFITKSGANRFHGSLFEYFQNDALDATPRFDSSKPRVRANDYGGSISGPVLLPYFNGRDRTFFFFDYERNVQANGSKVENSVPTQAMRNGDFSGLLVPDPGTGRVNPILIIDPSTGLPFSNNMIPSNRLNPISLNILNTYYPLQNKSNTNSANPTNNYLVNVPSPIRTYLYDVRIDQVLTAKQSISARFSWKNITNIIPQALSPQTGEQNLVLDPRSVAISYNYAITPNLLNEFRFGYNYQNTLVTFPHFPNGANLISQLGLKQLGPFPSGSGFPDFNFTGSSGVDSTPGGRDNPLREQKYQFGDNLTWIKGRHTVKLGFDIRALGLNTTNADTTADNFGDYYFNGQYTNNDFADFLFGLPDFTTVVNPGPNVDGHVRDYGFFAQDSFKVTRKLTVDLGLRYEYHPPFHETNFELINFDRTTGAEVVPNAASLALQPLETLQAVNACGISPPQPPPFAPSTPCTPVQTAAQAGIPETLRFSDKTVFLPRLDFAYKLTDRTVVRGGAGLYDETVLGSVFYSLAGLSDYQQFNNSTPASLQAGGTPTIQFPNTKTNASVFNGGPAGNTNFGTANQFNLRDPYGEQWSLTLERDLGWATGLRLTYTGLHSIGLIVSPDLNQIHPQTTTYSPTQRPFPNFNHVESRDNGGFAMYHGLETVLTHRFTSGTTFQSSLVWSKNLSDAQGDAPSVAPAENGPRVMDRFNLRSDYGNVSFTPRLRWLTTGTTELPLGRGKRFGSNMNRALDAVVGGWQTSNIFVYQTGPYETPFYSGHIDPSGTNAPRRSGNQRPDRLPVSACAGLDTSTARVFGGSCFFYGWPGPIGRFGNSGVGILEAPGTVVWNTGLAKNFAIHEGSHLRLEGTFNNILNHPNLGAFPTNVNSSNFGVITSTQSNNGAGARVIQLALRLDF